MYHHEALNRMVFGYIAVFAAVLMLFVGLPALATAEVEINEVMEVEAVGDPNPMTAIEIIIGKRIPETIQEGDRPPHVYRPRTPIFHHHHPENTSVEPEIRKHLLVDHPEVDNNQGRKIRTSPVESDNKVESNSTP